jgi:ADP-ribose pyrophosphatase YjhB (NUDIX family)
VLIVDGDVILLGKRSGEPGRGMWALPSGYIEFDDDFLSTGIKEAREETGLDVEIHSVLHVQSSFLPPGYHFLTVFLLAGVTGGALCAEDDLEELAWYPLAGPFPEMAFQPDLDIIQFYIENGNKGLYVKGHGTV